MLRDIEDLLPTEVEQIKKVIQDLFKSTCILEMKYDMDTASFRDNIRYKHCVKYREFIADYVEMMDCTLIHDSSEHLFRIVGSGSTIEKISLLTTRILVLFKLIYHDKIMGDGLKDTLTNLAEIRQYGADTHLLTRKLTDTEWNEALILLRQHQIITFNGATSNLEDNSPIYIYGTINIFVNTASIGELVKYYANEEDSYEAI